MPKPRKTSLETPTARLRLPIQKKPHWLRLGPGLSLGYRRNETAGTWSIRAADGRGGEWLKKFARSNDFEPADGKQVLSYAQAIEAAHKLVRGDDKAADQGKPVTLDVALTRYEADLTARQANSYNARWAINHLTASLLSKPVTLLDSHELRKWRDGLLAKMKPASVNRVIGNVVAALNLAAAHDQRVRANKQAWEIGLQGLPDAQAARNVVLSDDQVRAFVAAAYVRDQKLGLFMDTLSVTGGRPSQAARLTVADLVAHRTEPKLLMPRSAKGGGRLRSAKRTLRTSVPITAALATKLKEAAKGRAADAPLLTQADGAAWGGDPSKLYRATVREIVTSLGWDPDEISAYALRHSAIVRWLLAGTPTRVVAATCDTSIGQIEAHYSKYIAEHSDAIARRALLHHDEPPATDNVVVPLAQ